jgi:hypothetical protein
MEESMHDDRGTGLPPCITEISDPALRLAPGSPRRGDEWLPKMD